MMEEHKKVKLQHCTLSFDTMITELLELQNFNFKKVFRDLDNMPWFWWQFFNVHLKKKKGTRSAKWETNEDKVQGSEWTDFVDQVQ